MVTKPYVTTAVQLPPDLRGEVEVLAAAEAARWLLMAGLDLPEDLAEFEEDLVE